MTAPKRSLTRRILIDIAGFGMIIAAPLLGWLPGPGGIPLFLGGLALLATNHEWARRWLAYFKKHGTKISNKIFPDHWLVKILYDVIGVLLFILLVIFLINNNNRILDAVLTASLISTITILLFNRKRIHQVAKVWPRRPKKKAK